MQVGDQISDLKLGNGSSVLITANIASSLPASVGAALTQAASKDSANLGIYGIAFLLTTLGVVYVQEAERQIPMNYSSAYRSSTSLSRQAYLPFKVSLSHRFKGPFKRFRSILLAMLTLTAAPPPSPTRPICPSRSI